MECIATCKMCLLHFFFITLLVLVRMTVYTCGSSCDWKLDVVQSFFPYVVEPIVNNREHHAPMDFEDAIIWNIPTEAQTLGFPYFIRLEVQCDGVANPVRNSALMSAGSYPKITISYGARQVWDRSYHTLTDFIFEGALVDMSESCEFELCRPVWLVPLPTDSSYLIVHIRVQTTGIGTLDTAWKFIAFDGYSTLSSSNSSEVDNILGQTVAIFDLTLIVNGRAFPLQTFPTITSTQAIAGFLENPVLLVSSDFFQHFSAIKVRGIESNSTCSLGPAVKEVATFPDRILISTIYGVFEAFGDFSYPSEQSGEMMPGVLHHIGLGDGDCVHHFVLSQQDWQSRQNLLAVSQDKQRVFRASVEYGITINMEELISTLNTGPCDVVGTSACSVIDAAVKISERDTTFVLLARSGRNTEQYHLRKYTGLPGEGYWDTIFDLDANISISKDPHGDPSWYDISLHSREPWEQPEASSTTSQLNLTLSGLTFSSYISQHLFLWGSSLLHSPSGGQTLQLLLDYDSDAAISLFIVGKDSSFVFLNIDQEIWYGLDGDKVHLKKLRPSDGWDHMMRLTAQELDPSLNITTLSLFYDAWGTLYEFIAFGNATHTDYKRRRINYGDVIAYEMFAEAKQEMQHQDGHFVGNSTGEYHQYINISPLADFRCPYRAIHFETPGKFGFERKEKYSLAAPQLTDGSLGHSEKSLMAYQAIVHHLLLERTAEHTIRENELAADTHDPFLQWHREIAAQETFNQYLFQTKNPDPGIFINPDSYQLQPFDDVITETSSLPNVIYLDKHDAFNLSVFFEIDLFHLNIEPSDLKVLAELSDDSMLTIEAELVEYHLNNSVRYEIAIWDKGGLALQAAPGVDLYPASVLLQVWHSTFTCFEEVENTLQPGGLYTMDVMLGCPPGKKLVFDLKLSIERLEERFIYDCPKKTENRPCIHYEHDFRPLFKVVDFTTGEASLFTGLYTLTVLGGSSYSEESIKIFTSEERDRYNRQDMFGARIWRPKEEESLLNGSIPVYSHLHNGISWICQEASPCANIPMHNFPYSPEYYFLIEMSNMGVDAASTYCHYRLQFVVHVHGMDISSKMALIIVGWSLVFSILAAGIFMLCNYDNARLWRRCRRSCRRTDPLIRVAPMSSESSSEVELEVHYREGLDHRPIGESTTSTYIERLIMNDEDYPPLPSFDINEDQEAAGNISSGSRISNLHHRSVSGSILHSSRSKDT